MTGPPAELARRRSRSYVRLALPFARSPGPFLAALAEGRSATAFARDLDAIAPGVLAHELTAFTKAIAGSRDAVASRRLVAEHARLFTGPGRVAAPPYESVHQKLGRQMMGESAVDAARAYRAAGLVLTGPPDPPDHLETELQFMALLAGTEAVAVEAGEVHAALRALEAQRRFLDEHLARWVPRFAADVVAAGADPVFASAARLVDAFVALDLRVLGSRLAALAPLEGAAE